MLENDERMAGPVSETDASVSKKRQPGLARLQDLIGSMKSVYLNDRASNRADKLIPMLDEAFEIILRLRSARGSR